MPKTRAGSGQINPNLVFQGDVGITIPTGTTAQRNATPQAGEIRYNTQLNVFEGYTGTTWGSMGPYPFAVVEYFTGDGTTSEFELNNDIQDAEYLWVTINGVQLRADVDYDLSYANRIRFIDSSDSSNDPPAANAEIAVRMFQPVTSASIPAGSITAQELSASGTTGQVLSLASGGNLQFITIPTQTPTLGGDLSGTTANAQIRENTVGITELNVSDGILGQVLTTDGSGNLAFTSIPGVATAANVLKLAPLNAPPASVQTGTFAVADRTSWDPATKGSGAPYPVFYDGIIWRALY